MICSGEGFQPSAWFCQKERAEGMNILITGGMGALGSFVTRKLTEMGMEPILYSRHKEVSLIRDIENKVVIVEGDILDFDKLIKTIKTHEIERIIHAAAMLRESESDPPGAVRINVEGTANILHAALKGDVDRVVYISAKGVYSETQGEYAHPTYKPMNEDYPTDNNMGFYGLTKLCAEKVGCRYEQKYGIHFIALRLSSTYGPGKILKRVTRGAPIQTAIQATIIENTMLGKTTRLSQGADQKNDFIYAKDAATGIVSACIAESLEHRIFNIGRGEGSTLLDFADAVKTIYPKANIEIGQGLDYLKIGYNTYSVYDISRAKKEFNFSPQYNIEKGVKDYVETLQQLNIGPTYTPTFQNISGHDEDDKEKMGDCH
jgi:UDP-glucose 4-epimerase